MARIALGAVGAAIGLYLGGPGGALQGFTIAYGLGAGLDPNQKVLGPRLQDLKAPQASYGAVIPYLEGAPRLAGCYIWGSAKREIASTTTEGKGGPGVDSTTFTYEIDCLIELAINRCEAIRRVWSNGKLVWSEADDADAETLVASSQTTSWRDMRFYDGNPSQLPDPTYEASVGVGNAPAYRTRTTVMIEGLNLGGSGQLPVLTFEVVSEADQAYTATNFATFPLEDALDTVPFLSGISAMNPDGFDFLYGVDYDSGDGGHLGFKVFHVDMNGDITETAEFDYGGGKEGNALQGSSDESVLVVQEFDGLFIPQIDHVTMYRTDGTHVAFSFGVVADTDSWTFAKRGDYAALVSTTFGGSRQVRVYNADTGVLIGSAVMAASMQFAAIGDGVLYALDSDASQNGINVYEIDLATVTLIQTIPTPITAVQSAIACDESGKLFLFAPGGVGNDSPVYEWDGATWTKILNEPLLYSAPSFRHAYYAQGGVLAVHRFDNSGVAPFREQFYIADRRVSIVAPSLADVVERLCIRTGQLETTDLDLTELESDVVRSMAISQVTTTRSSIESTMAGYLYEWAEGAKLRAVKRGGASVVTIPYEDLGCSQDGTAEPLPKKRANDMETVARISVKYANVLNDSQDGLEQADRLVTDSTAETLVEIPFGFTPTEAKRLADANTMDQAVGILSIGPVSLSRKYSYLEPADVITVTDSDGSTFRCRIVRMTIGSGVITCDLVLDDATAISSVASTDDSYASSTLIRVLSDSDLEVLDIPILRDVDDALGPYIAVAAGDKWSAAQIDRSVDNVTFTKVTAVTVRSIIGTATVLPDFTGGFGCFDDTSSVTVTVSGTLTSCTKVEALAGLAPAYLIGEEIVYACTATFISTGVYRLTSFLRGLLGTGWAMPDHVDGERVVLLEALALRKLTDDASDLNVVRYYRATTIGKSVDSADTEAFTDTGVAKTPYAPGDIQFDTATEVFAWNRRSRLRSAFLGIPPPLGEASESYDIEIRDAVDALQVSATVTEPEYDASALSVAAGYTFTVWQNGSIGRGYPATLEIP